MRYLVSYDISDPKDRDTVTSKLKCMGAKPVLESQWILDKDSTNAKDLGNDLLEGLGENVRLLVNNWDCSVAATHNLLCEKEDIKPFNSLTSSPDTERLQRLFRRFS